MKQYTLSFLAIVFSVFGISAAAATESTEGEESESRDTLTAQTNNHEHCASPYVVDYFETLEAGAGDSKFPGCGGLI